MSNTNFLISFSNVDAPDLVKFYKRHVDNSLESEFRLKCLNGMEYYLKKGLIDWDLIHGQYPMSEVPMPTFYESDEAFCFDEKGIAIKDGSILGLGEVYNERFYLAKGKRPVVYCWYRQSQELNKKNTIMRILQFICYSYYHDQPEAIAALSNSFDVTSIITETAEDHVDSNIQLRNNDVKVVAEEENIIGKETLTDEEAINDFATLSGNMV